MSKLLKESRMVKAITEPKKKVKYVRTREKGSVKYTLISESNKRVVNELFDLYKENPFKARVKFFNSGRDQYHFTRTVLFEFDGDSFQFVYFQINFGISISNRIYSSEKKLYSISYNKGKFWYKNNKTITPLTFSKFKSFLGVAENIYDDKWGAKNVITATQKESKIRDYFIERFPWIRMLYECPISLGVIFNQVVAKKLFGMNDIYRHLMKVPPRLGKMVADSETFRYLRESTGKSIKPWQETLKVLDGIEHLTLEMLNDHHFVDTCKMARTLGRTVNCRWGTKRLKEEHDKWAREIGNIVLDCEKEYELNIKPIFKAFADFSDFQLLKTNKEMLLEGMVQNHCVGTYIDQVNRGDSAIYNVDGYTLQLSVRNINREEYKRLLAQEQRYAFANGRNNVKISVFGGFSTRYYEEIDPKHTQYLANVQFRGKHNRSAPEELVRLVDDKLIEFVNADCFEKVSKNEYEPKITHSDINGLGVFDFGLDAPFGERFELQDEIGFPMHEVVLEEAQPCVLGVGKENTEAEYNGVEMDHNVCCQGNVRDESEEDNIRAKVTYDENELYAMLKQDK